MKPEDDYRDAGRPGTGKESPKRWRRLRVVMDDDAIVRAGVRDIWLDSTAEPWKLNADGRPYLDGWVNDLFNLAVPCEQVVDLIRFARLSGCMVEYDPPQNMRGWFSRKNQKQVPLFDIG